MAKNKPKQSPKKQKQPKTKKIEKTTKSQAKESKPKFTRLGKVDFKPDRLKHQSLMQKAGCKVDRMIALRRQLHSWPEGKFNEYKTQQTLIDTLISIGVDKKAITKCAKTGLVVDIKGTGKASGQKGGCKMIAIRADTDGLPMPENNQSLPYKT